MFQFSSENCLRQLSIHIGPLLLKPSGHPVDDFKSRVTRLFSKFRLNLSSQPHSVHTLL